MNFAEAVLSGDRRVLARLLTKIENGDPEGMDALDRLFPCTGKAHLVGVTGAPGSGKSSLVNQLARYYRHPADGSAPLKVAVVAVDPTSPFTGGALLGDRVRMHDLTGDPGIFIRSMASRGALGGLAHATAAVAQALDAAGFDMILVETVGVGQSEVEIVHLAQTTLVIEAPGMGDDIQAGKAGILEIADILVVNKADRPGVENTEKSLRQMLEMGYALHGNSGETPGWIPPVLRTVAVKGEGVPFLVQEISSHAEHLRKTGLWQQREQMRLKAELDHLLQATLVARWNERTPDGRYQNVLAKLCQRQISPYYAVNELLSE